MERTAHDHPAAGPHPGIDRADRPSDDDDDPMALHIFRAHVAGFFPPLAEEVRARLLADADAHDDLRAAFTPAGTLSYDRRLTRFRYRYEVRVEADTPDAARDEMEQTVRTAAHRDLARLGITDLDPGSLRVSGTDMRSMWDR
jgi:hypothetical protein